MIDVRSLPGAKVVTMITDGGYFPVLAALPDDSITAVLRMGAGHVGLAGRLDAIRSTDGGLTWSAPITIADSDADDRNPALGYHDGAVICAYHIQRNYDDEGRYGSFGKPLDTWLTRSRDGGKTWGTPYLMSHDPLQGASPFGKIVALTDGTLLLPIYDWSDASADEDALFGAYLLRSRDGGATWQEPALIAEKFNETALLLMPDGKLLAAIRTGFPGVPDHVWLTSSDDAGRTWAEPAQATQRNEHPADLALLSDGSVLMTYGRRHEPYGVRGMIRRDGEWSEELVFADDAASSDCGYPSTVRLADGRMVTAYYGAAGQWDAYDERGCAAKAVLYREEDLLEAVG
jgi:hypothetical protein